MKNIQTYFQATKIFIAVLFITALPLSGKAQVDTGFVSSPLTSMPKVTVRLNSGNTVKGSVARITDSTITLDVPLQTGQQSPDMYADTLLYGKLYVLRTEDIRYVKVRRNAFLSGVAVGGLIGYGLGYGLGYVSHKDDDSKDYYQNKEDAKTRGVGVGIVGAAALGLAGGVIAPVMLRKKFFINGKRGNMQKLIKVLMHVL